MGKQFYINNVVRIKNRSIYNNQELLFRSELDIAEIDLFFKEAYQFLQLSYPKFFKMDRISKLGILATEILFNKEKQDINTALVFSNNSSSLDTDKIHQNALSQIVSPSVFVYTLPNIILGEISIRHQLQSENIFFLSETFDAELIGDYTQVLLDSGKAKDAVCGWIDLKNAEYDVFLCLISEVGEIPFTSQNLEQLYYFENE